MKKLKAFVTKVYDGDTITCNIEKSIGFGMKLILEKKQVRIYGIDTPEVRHKDPLHKAFGIEVRDYLRSLIVSSDVEIELVLDNDKYGRLLAYVSINDMDISSHLLSVGMANEYYGGTKKEWEF